MRRGGIWVVDRSSWGRPNIAVTRGNMEGGFDQIPPCLVIPEGRCGLQVHHHRQKSQVLRRFNLRWIWAKHVSQKSAAKAASIAIAICFAKKFKESEVPAGPQARLSSLSVPLVTAMLGPPLLLMRSRRTARRPKEERCIEVVRDTYLKPRCEGSVAGNSLDDRVLISYPNDYRSIETVDLDLSRSPLHSYRVIWL